MSTNLTWLVAVLYLDGRRLNESFRTWSEAVRFSEGVWGDDVYSVQVIRLGEMVKRGE